MPSDGLQTHPHHSIKAGDTLCHLWMLGNVSTGFTLNSGTFVYGKYFLLFNLLKPEKGLIFHSEWHRTIFTNEPVATRWSTIPANTTLSHNVGLMLAQRRRRCANIKPPLVSVSCLLVSDVTDVKPCQTWTCKQVDGWDKLHLTGGWDVNKWTGHRHFLYKPIDGSDELHVTSGSLVHKLTGQINYMLLEVESKMETRSVVT